MPDFDAFLTRVLVRPLPRPPIARVRLLAKELAEGAVEEVWPSAIEMTEENEVISETEVRRVPAFRGEYIRAYLQRRWNNEYPKLHLLVDNGYLTTWEQNRFNFGYQLTKAAFDLLEEAAPASIFISYKRSESSAFALLVLARLKEHGLDAFVDLTIQPGDNWQQHLRDQVRQRQYFVALLGRGSLASEVVQQELTWALESGAAIIPIWHNGFTYRSGEIALPPRLDALLSSTHTIRVLEESALAYNNAIVELLNRFGITP
jgi:hypothetical protein